MTMRKTITLLVFSATVGLFVSIVGCSKEKDPPRTVINPTDAGGAPIAGMAHGNHNPKYGGVVLMNGDLHFEVVVNADGHYALYFSDAGRQELPASSVSGVTLGIKRPGFRVETIDMKINDTGESWIGTSGSVDDRNTDIYISFTFQGKRCTSSMPFFAGEAQKMSMQNP
jgi:hypothetical protein